MNALLPSAALLGTLAALVALPHNARSGSLPNDTSFTYQGELKADGAAAGGFYDFEICLFDDGDPVITTALGCTTRNDVPLDPAGRFTLRLDFGAQFIGLPRFLELRVRPGADTGAYVTLLPRQAIRPTPEALYAASAPWDGIAAVPAGFADGVDHAGITSLAAGAGLTTNPATPGAGAPISTTGTLSVRAAGIDAGMIAPGAVGLAQIDPSQVQARVAASCAPGEYLTGISADGTPACVSLPARFDQVIDQSGDVGSQVAIALHGDDRPILAYYSASAGNLKLHNCGSRACLFGTTRTLDSAGDVGRGPAIAIGADGRAFVAYQDLTNLALKLYVCANVACSSGSARTLDAARDVSASIDLVIRGDGRPLVVYGNTTDFDARAFDCADVDCSSGVSRSLTASMFNGSSLAAVLDSSGLPVIAKGGNGGAGVPAFLLRCSDVACSAVSVTSLVSVFSAQADLVVRASDLPMLAVSDAGIGVRVVDCTSPTCSAHTLRAIDPNASDRVSLALDASVPVLAFRRFISADETRLRFHRCLFGTCSDGATRTLDGDIGEAVGAAAAMAVRSDGRPVIAHYDSTHDDLLLHICANRDCL